VKIPNDIKKQVLAEKDHLSEHELSKKYRLRRSEVRKIVGGAGRKTPRWFYAVTLLLPVLFLVLLEMGLRVAHYGYDFGQWVEVGDGKQVLNPNIGRKYFTSVNFNPTTSEDEFDAQKKGDAFRVFVLGESSAEGFPYSPMGSFSRYVRRRLELVYPNTPIEVINLGMTAISSYTLLDLLPGVLDQKPDVVLIYTGHNEYYGALGVGSVQSFGSSRTLIRVMMSLNGLRITQLVRNSIDWFSSLFSSGGATPSGTLMSTMAKDKYVLLNSEVFNEGIQQFRDNLTSMMRLAEEKHVPVILGRLVSNVRGQKPFISVGTPGYQTADQVFEEAENALANNRSTLADSLFILAKDLDALRFRAPEQMNRTIDEIGKEFHTAVVPIDSIFDSASPYGIAGDNLLVDHLHPNVHGYQLMGKAFYECMEKEGDLPKTQPSKIPPGEQDSLTRANFVFTELDSVIGNDNVAILKRNWPYVEQTRKMSDYQEKDFIDLLQPKNVTDSIAVLKTEGRISWTDAHLLLAATYLKRDDIDHYVKHIDVLLYQYPVLKDFHTFLTYFYRKNKIDLSDYTSKRVGFIQLSRGDYDDAIKYLTEAYHSNPKDHRVLYDLSLAYSKRKDFNTALTMIDECLTMDRNDTEANKLRREILSLSGKVHHH